MSTRRRRWQAALAAVVVLLAGWLVWCHAVVQTPRVDAAGPVDAVLVLGGLDGPQRTERALQLVDAGMTRTVVVSTPVGYDDPLARRICATPPAGVRVVCFVPDPATTRGEARELARLAREGGWDRVAVVTSRYHVSRSRTIVARCVDARVSLLVSGEHISAWTWAYQYLYQSAASVKAQLLRSC